MFGKHFFIYLVSINSTMALLAKTIHQMPIAGEDPKKAHGKPYGPWADFRD